MISIYPKIGAFSSVNFPFNPIPTNKFSDLPRYITRHTWSPIIYSDQIRREDNFKHSWFVGLDFDEGLTLQAAIENIFCDMRHIIGTTRSHQKPKGDRPACDRFRVILQFSECITDLRTYKWNINRCISHYESDMRAKGASRLFFPCQEIVSVGDGYLLDVEKPPAWFMDNSAKDAELAAYSNLGELPFWLKRNLDSYVPQGRRNDSVFGMAKDLSKIKFNKTFVESTLYRSRVYQENSNDKDFVRGFNSTINSIFRRGGA